MEYSAEFVKQTLASHGKELKKSLGQNFLYNGQIIGKIVSAAGTGSVLEIGAGIGLLTHALCENAERVVTVEIDSSLAPILRETVPDSNFTLHMEDILKTVFSVLQNKYFAGEHFTVVGNLPYYISTEILEKLMENVRYFDRAVIMVQKEFADRLQAVPGTKQYRAVTVLANYLFEIEKICAVPPHNFIPAPHVESTVACLSVRKNREISACQESDFYRFIKSAFANRRKQISVIAPSLGLSKEEFGACMQSLGLTPALRAETLTPSDFAALFLKVKEARK